MAFWSLTTTASGNTGLLLATSLVIGAAAVGAPEIASANQDSIEEASTALMRIAAGSSKRRIAVIGDSLAFELWKGLTETHRGSGRYEFLKFSRVSTGLVRRDVYNWNNKVRDIVAGTRFDMALVIIGGNDRQSMWVNKRRLQRFTKPWYRVYSRRADAFMKTLRRSGKPVYWVGLPIVRPSAMRRDYRRLNRVYKRVAAKNGVHYISSWRVFADSHGRYTGFGRDKDGARRRMRDNDGLHFSPYGRLKFGRFVFRRIRRELGLDIRPPDGGKTETASVLAD